jgi:hypothetical protein
MKIKDRAFQKSFFHCSKLIAAAAAADLRKMAVLTFDKKNIFQFFLFWFFTT